MKYRFSFDLGVSSIGSAVITLNSDNEAENIIDAGVRIFNVSEGAEERRAKKQARKNNIRTKQRLQLLAQKLYEHGFWEFPTQETPLAKQKIPPYSLSPYAIRAYAIRGKLHSPYELGRAILHLAKHRGAGFIDAVEDSDAGVTDFETEKSKNKGKQKLSSYEKLPEYMKANGAKTIGEYFYTRLCQTTTPPNKASGRIVRQRTTSLIKEKMVDYAIPRYLVKDEFNKIWDKQAEYYPALQDINFRNDIYNILFYERPSAPYATADCIYIDGEKRLLKAHPLSEKRRIYEAVNNISIMTNTTKRKLTKDERDTVIKEILMKGKNANKTSVREALFNKDKAIGVVFADSKNGIEPYIYSKEEFTKLPIFQDITEDGLTKIVEFMANPEIPGDKHGRLYCEDDLISELQKMLKLEDRSHIENLLAKLPKGRGSLGITATKKILEKLASDVISHREATDKLVSEGDARFKSEEVLAQEIQGKYKELPYYGKILKKDTQPIHPWVKERIKTLHPDEALYGKIANPAVHMMLNQLRLVVNDMIRIYGKPYEINIELGRDVGLSSKKKKDFEKIQNDNKKVNDTAFEALKKHNEENTYKIKINRENILKYKLMMEQNQHDAFNPEKPIHINRLNDFEIEHLIPRSKGGTDTYNNLVLVDRTENAGKGNLYPYEFFEQNKSPEEIREILRVIRNNSKMSDGKKWRFEQDAREKFENSGDEDETNRYLTDTRYMAKLAARYLRAILDYTQKPDDDVINTRVLTVKGAHTAKLRTVWNLDGLEYDLMGLNIPREIEMPLYWVNEDTGEVKEQEEKPDIDGNWKPKRTQKNPDWKRKPRIDHRHHALDAIALGCINRNFTQHMNWADKRGTYVKSADYPLPLSSLDTNNPQAATAQFRKDVFNTLSKVKVSHKAEHSKNGQLHKESGKAILPIDEKYGDIVITKKTRNVLSVVKKKSDLSKLRIIPAIKSEWHEEIAQYREELEKLIADIESHFAEAKSILENQNKEFLEEGKKEKDISESRIVTKAFELVKEKGLWKGDKFPTYANEKSLIIINKHKMAYTSGNNHRVDFYEKDGKVAWQVISNFNANDNTFIPESKKSGAKAIWSIQQGDLIELDTPEQWKHFTNDNRCIAQIRKFTNGKLAISYYTDSRMTSPPAGSPHYMSVEMFADNGLSFYSSKNTRKIELTPFGKLKKKHKVLWHGKKNKS